MLLLAAIPLPQASAQEPADATRTTVEVIVAKILPLIEEVPISGTINPLQQALLSAEVSGLVDAIPADIGHQVVRGDLLLTLDPELNNISRDAAQAEVIRSREALADSRRRLQELQALIADQHVAETEVESLASEVRTRDAQLQAAKIEVERQSALLRRHRIEAPFSGTISQRHIDVGEWVQPGTALFELVETGVLRADFQVPQRYFPQIQNDTAIRVTLDDGRTFTARTEHKIPVSRSGSRTFLLRTVVESKEPLIPGLSASATLQLKRDKPGIALPRDAVLRYPDGRITVWIADASAAWGTPASVREQQVTTGLSFNGLIEIKTGVEAGQRVIVRGNESLQRDQAVIIQPSQR